MFGLDKIILGLDLSHEVLEHNRKILIEKFNITDEEIDAEDEEDN